MANPTQISPANGFCAQTKTFHSLRPHAPIPPLSDHRPLSVTDYALSFILPSSATHHGHPYIIDASSDAGSRLTFFHTLRRANSLAVHLHSSFHLSLSKGDVAFILLPPSLHVPVVYLSLLSLGIVVSPANPLGSASDIAHQLHISKSSLVFATSATALKLPTPTVNAIRRHGRLIIIDSPEFESMLNDHDHDSQEPLLKNVNGVNQSDPATILYSSGTTGRVKGVVMTHRNLIAVIAGQYPGERNKQGHGSSSSTFLFLLPHFHVYGFIILMLSFVLGETLVWMPRFNFEEMLKAVEKYKVTGLPVSPPIVVRMVKSKLTEKYDLSSVEMVVSAGAPLGREVSEQFQAKFPNVQLLQGYAMTESGTGSGMASLEESKRYGSVGRLSVNVVAKIVDADTGEALPPGHKGVLWLRGPCIMKGYAGDDETTAETIDADGWLKTGDLCYIDDEGFLFIVDRVKELIKYKAYQVPPAELEHLLQSLPEIADAAVIPYPDEDAGQIPMAFVVRKPGSDITASQVMDLVAKQVAPYKKVRRVAFLDSIPKTPAGKILRKDLVSQSLTSSTKARL